jgi:molybdopterin synthase catalytic subunit
MFGGLAERVGAGDEVIDLGDAATAGDVLRSVRERFPGAAALLDRVSVAVNLEVTHPERRLAEDDEVALMPPVAGGARVLVGLRDRPSVDEALVAVGASGAGGTALFVGTVRDEGGRVRRLEYSAYPEMADRVLAEIADQAAAKWPLEGVAILHAVGDLAVGERTVVVACSAPHRAEALEACRHVIDEVKRRAPIWKKEIGPDGSRWIGLEP